jgi:transposase
MAKAKKTKAPSASEMTSEDLSNLDHDTLVGLVLRLCEQNKQLSEILQVMVREKHGPKTEHFENPEQLRLFGAEKQPEATVSTSGNDTAEPEKPSSNTNVKSKKKPGHGRNPMPSNLDRETITGSQPSKDELACKHCAGMHVKINEVLRNSRYEYKPSSVFIQDFVAMIFQCEGCGDTLTVEPELKQTIENGMAGPALTAEIITAKLEDHLPLHRQEQRFARMGVPLARSTMVGWMSAAALKLKPIFDRMHQLLLQSKIIATDDTPTKVQDRKKKKNIKTGRVWIYRGDDDHPVNLFDYTEGRGRVGPMTFLADFTGYLQGDCFSGNLAVCASTGAIFVACRAHARRYFIKAQPNNKTACEEILKMFADLFEIERTARALELSAEETKRMREQEAVPILNKMKKLLDDQCLTMLPQSSFGKAVNYNLNNWTELNNYLLDGDLRLDNNLAEQEMKRVAVGRKNWNFLGSDDAGKNYAMLLSLISTCKRHGVNSAEYLKDVLQILTDNPNADIDPLLPQNWKKKGENAEIPACQTAPQFALR